MTSFNESNTVESFVRDQLCGVQPGRGRAAEVSPAYVAGRNKRGLGWHYVPSADLPRRIQDVFNLPGSCKLPGR